MGLCVRHITIVRFYPISGRGHGYVLLSFYCNTHSLIYSGTHTVGTDKHRINRNLCCQWDQVSHWQHKFR